MKIDKDGEKTCSLDCKNKERSCFCALPSASEARHVAVCLQGRQQDVDEPEGEEHEEGEELGCPWAPELSARHTGTSAVEQHHHTHQRHDGEEGDREGQGAWVYVKCLAFGVPVNCCNGPRHPDAEEYIYCVAACHISDRGIGVLILDGSHLTCKRVCNRKRSGWIFFK